MSAENLNLNPGKSQTPKLTPAQRKILTLLNEGVGIRRRHHDVSDWYYRENQDDKINQLANSRTISALFAKGLVAQFDYDHDGRKYKKLELTDLGRRALETPTQSADPASQTPKLTPAQRVLLTQAAKPDSAFDPAGHLFKKQNGKWVLFTYRAAPATFRKMISAGYFERFVDDYLAYFRITDLGCSALGIVAAPNEPKVETVTEPTPMVHGYKIGDGVMHEFLNMNATIVGFRTARGAATPAEIREQSADIWAEVKSMHGDLLGWEFKSLADFPRNKQPEPERTAPTADTLQVVDDQIAEKLAEYDVLWTAKEKVRAELRRLKAHRAALEAGTKGGQS